MAEHTHTRTEKKGHTQTHRQSQPREHPTERCAEGVELLQEVADIIPHTHSHTHIWIVEIVSRLHHCP